MDIEKEVHEIKVYFMALLQLEKQTSARLIKLLEGINDNTKRN